MAFMPLPTLMSAQQPIAGNRLMQAPQPPPNLFGLGEGETMVTPPWVKFAYSIMGMAAGGALTYHGYKRNDESVPWALAWGLLGGIVWPITLPIALGQGFGKLKH